MRDRTPTKLPVPVFTPVPRRKPRHDGWTPERQKAFIEALAETGSVKHAAERINMAPEGAYALRRQPGAESFVKAWDAALDHGVQSLRDIAIDRAREGQEVPVYSYGKLVGKRRVYNDRLLMFCIKHNIGRLGGEDPRPLRPGTKSAQTAAREMEALKAEWLEEYRESLAHFIRAEADALAQIAQAVVHMVRREAQAREAGAFDLEDHYKHNSDHLIYCLQGGPGKWEEARALFEALNGTIAALKERYQPHFGTGVDTWTGPTWRERDAARQESQRLIAKGRAMWVAATNEEAWAEWKAKWGGTGFGG